MTASRGYNRTQSRLFRLKSPNQLCALLAITPLQLQELLTARENYLRWTDKVTGRPIQCPKPRLDRIHRRVATLLARMETPDFLHSAVQGRSYITNADCHDPNQATIKVDIKKFYPSARAQAVFHFFLDRMECEGDVAGILAQLLTVDGHLPTGSSASPILSYFAYEDMFGEIFELAIERGCQMTCYVDDMVITGPEATRRMIRDVIVIVRKYRLWGHKTKAFKQGQPKIITGVAVTKVGRRLPNQRQHRIAQDFENLKHAKTEPEKLVILRKLTGRLFEAAQVDATWRKQAEASALKMKQITNALPKR